MNKLSFLVIRADYKLTKEAISARIGAKDPSFINLPIYYCYQDKNLDLPEGEISYLFRNSSSFKITEYNSCSFEGMKFIFSEKGFIFLGNLDDMFERCVFMFILLLSYRYYSEHLINQISDMYANNRIKDMIKTRDDYLYYNFTVYYSNPIKHNAQTLFETWKTMFSYYHIDETHSEVKSQFSDLVEVIQNKRNDLFQKVVGIAGIIIAIVSIFVAFK